MLSISPLLAWFFTFILILLGGRATARLVLAGRGRGVTPRISSLQRNRELGHAAMSFGMALLLVPGLPRPPQAASVGFFAVLAALAALDWGRRAPGLSWLRRRRREAAETCAGTEGGHLLDPHHAIVGAAMVVMLLRPGMASTGAGIGAAIGAGTGSTATGAVAMPGMVMGAAPSTTVLLLLAYVWLAALVLGVGMTRVLATNASNASDSPKSVRSGTLLSSPPTIYACELAMTVLTGLMLLS